MQDVRRIECVQHKLTELRSAFKGPANVGVVQDQLAGIDQRLSDRAGILRIAVMKKCSEAFQVGEGIGRPFQRHRSRQDRNEGVPQVFSQRTTSWCATVSPPA